MYLLYSGKKFRQNALASFSGDMIYVYNWNGDKMVNKKYGSCINQAVC